MKKILTSHVGSLPRSQAVVDYIFARENKKSYNTKAFDICMTEACSNTVKRQVDAGIDIVSDGETSKSLMQLMLKIVIQVLMGIALGMLQQI